MSAQLPEVQPFKYLYIPADNSAPLEVRDFSGTSEAELKKALVGHFVSNTLSNAQKLEMASHLYEKAQSNADKATANAPAKKVEELAEDGTPAEAPAAALPAKDSAQMAGLLAAAMENSSYEIVPVVMPMRRNKFIGTSLYIDDAGRFKDLPLNSRASRVAQKDIRGDAFMLSNHDDPALDEWRRVDCTVDTFETIAANPAPTLDTSNQAAMAQATMARENDAKVITAENAAAGIKAKADGNAFFAAGDLLAAVQAYSACVEATDGRADLCPNGEEVTAARTAAFLNRSLCYGRLGDWNAAEKDAAKVVYGIDGTNVKALFRLATARSHLKDFEGAEEALVACEAADAAKTAASDIAQLRIDMTGAKSRLEQAEKKKYAKMFA